MRHISPSVQETAFNCPHCDVLASQQWFRLYAEKHPEKFPLPIFKPFSFDHIEDVDKQKKLSLISTRMNEKQPFLNLSFESILDNKHAWLNTVLHNAFVSRCFNCKKESVWICDKLVYPQRGKAPPANPDLPDDIRRDYDEASSILDLSPRGAAALMRLSIQKLCKELGQPGKELNDDIGALVAKGLNEIVQQALDTVRVIGNNAVHPGQIDLHDDRATAESLFRLLNLIAEKMISEPKHVREAYAKLPEEARKAIKKRDANSGSNQNTRVDRKN